MRIHDDLPDELLKIRCHLVKLRRERTRMTEELRVAATELCSCQGKFLDPLDPKCHDDDCPAKKPLIKSVEKLVKKTKRKREDNGA